MNNQEKLEFISNTIHSITKTKPGSVEPNMELVSLGLDSLDIVEIQLAYEDFIHAEITTDAPIHTVQDLMDLMT